ncbi:MAG: NAD(P)-dependent glycerol-3-phosphate dehydrogenase, partial [Lentisphaeria bacterium]|nr:NAD(P)-dependent glycerol-3-phosphate dehydrogenase [Lentisphaeria bacterium]
FESDAVAAVRNCDVILLATPTQFLRGVLKKMKGSVAPGRLVVNVAKGIEKDTFLRISEIVKEELGFVTFVDLSGPSHAEEVSRKVPTAVVAASNCLEAAETVQQLFMNENFRVYTSSDVIGVELGGALKNVMAIAAGIIDGMQLGDNPKAAFMTRAIYEMGKLGELLGGERATFSGLSGIGDLIVTCTSGHSRNRHVGEELGRGKTLKTILGEMGMVVAEGVPTALGAYTLARRVNAETPLIDSIYNILYNDFSARTALRELMTRSAKQEA